MRRGYPEKVINAEMCKVRFNSENRRFNNKQEKEVPFVVTFHSHLKVLQRIVDKHLHLLYMNDEVKRVFTPKPMVSFRSSCKISSYLVSYFLWKEPWAHLSVVISVAKSVNISLKQTLLPVVLPGKRLRLIIALIVILNV